MSERQRSWEINADQIRLALANNEQQRAVEIFVRLHPGDQVEVFDLLGDDVSNLLLQQLFGISNRLGADWQHACSGNRGYNYTVGIECFGSRPCLGIISASNSDYRQLWILHFFKSG